MKYFFAGLLMATAASLALPIKAQTGAQTPTRIENLRQTQGIILEGEVGSIVGNDFILNDGSGEVIVDAGPRWWQQLDLSAGEQVSVTGEAGRSGEFDAFSITRADGTVIEIRSPEGPPPWSGGRDGSRNGGGPR
jgi:uncharacterized protein YdeI (BOF family)